MGLFDPLKVNQPIQIELPGDEVTYYRSIVEAIFIDRFTVTSPTKAAAVIPLAPGTIVTIIFTDNTAIYTFTTEVISQNRKPPATLLLGKPIEMKRIQRRNFVRLDTRLPISLNKFNKNLHPGKELFSGTAFDISGGGMMFGCNTPLECGDVLEATINLNRQITVKTLGRVVRVMHNPPKSREKYSVGFEFRVIEEPVRDKIIRFIFNQQRELRKKGLL